MSEINPEEVSAMEKALSNIGRTSLLIAHERALESSRDDALFTDPFAQALAGAAGPSFSRDFMKMCTSFGFDEWPEFHQQWVAVRTAFVDAWVDRDVKRGQMVNVGAGVDTRAFRLESLREGSMWEVDMKTVNEFKEDILSHLHATPLCSRTLVNCDLCSGSLFTDLESAGFDSSLPSHWLLEGLLMYLPIDSQLALLKGIAGFAVPGSTAVINYLGVASEHPDSAGQTTEAQLREIMQAAGWKVEFHHFGGPSLNYGRYPQGLDPNITFSLAVCRHDN